MKRVVWFVTVLVALSVLPAFASNPPKEGAICSKQGATKILKNKKYTCIKNGKKLLWSKGVVIARAQPATSATPTMTLSPSPTPTSIPTSTPTPSPKIYPYLTFETLVENSELVPLIAWQAGLRKLSTPSKKIEITISVGPNSVSLNKDPYDVIAKVSSLYSESTQPDKLTILHFGQQDKDWAWKFGSDYLQTTGTFSRDWLDDWACPSSVRCWGAGSYTTGTPDKHLIVIATGVSHPSHFDGNVEAHEFTHNIQQLIMKAPQPWPLKQPWPPMWFTEGQANFAAMIYVGKTFEEYGKSRIKIFANSYRNKAVTKESIETFIRSSYSSGITSSDFWNQYEIGSAFIEILNAIAGPDKSMEIWTFAQQGMPFEKSFEKVYGVSLEKVAPVMAETIYKILNPANQVEWKYVIVVAKTGGR